MNTAVHPLQPVKPTFERLLSLDVMRGVIMILLAGEACRVYESLDAFQLPGVAGAAVQQFFHHPWNGLRFWDLVQPAFMTMAGAALYISFRQKQNKGISWESNFRHVAIRCFKLFLLGTGLHCIYAGELVWELWNVLTQLSVTTLIAYAIIRLPAGMQLAISFVLLILTEFLYRQVLMLGFDQPFTEGKNFGAWMDTVLMGKINSDGWVAINIIPTAAHTIWGCLAGKLLVSTHTAAVKIRILLLAAAIGLASGYALDVTGVTPIIKRISTSSFALVSGGWVMLLLAVFYWMLDIKKWNALAWVFVVVGMNSIFIYVFFETVGLQWLNGAVGVFVKGFSGKLGFTSHWQDLLSALTTWVLEWSLCYWLYKKKIFFKL